MLIEGLLQLFRRKLLLYDDTRAGVFKPVYDDKQSSATLMLLMPMMINA